jgi:hypothetical protein
MAESALSLRRKCAHQKTTGLTAASLGGHHRENQLMLAVIGKITHV